MIKEFLSDLYESNIRTEVLDENWNELLKEIKLFSLSAQVHQLIKETGLSDKFPESFLSALKSGAERVMFQSILVKQETVRVLKALRQEGIPVIPLKGVIFSEKYFGHFAARGTSDIDLLIHEQDLERASRCVRQLGFVLEDPYHSLHYHVEYAKPLPAIGESLSIEFHWNLLRKHTSTIDMNRLWEHSNPLQWEDIGGDACREFTLEHTFYTICLHSSKHHMLSLKHVLDIVHLIYRYGDQIDYQEVFQIAAQDRTVRKLQAALSIAYELFPRLQQVKPYRQTIKVPFFSFQIIRNSEQQIRGWRYYAYIFFYPLLSLDTWKYRKLHLLNMVFPPKDRIMRTLQEEKELSTVSLYWKLYKHRFRVWERHQKLTIRKR